MASATNQGAREPDVSPGCIWVVPAGSPDENSGPFAAAARLATVWGMPVVTNGEVRLSSHHSLTVAGVTPRVILLPVVANRLAVVLARRLGGQLCAGCQDLFVQGPQIEVHRLLYRKRIQARFRLPVTPSPLVITVYPRPAPAASTPYSADSSIPSLLAALPEIPGARVLRRFRVDPRELDLSEAEVIVAGGRGVGTARDWQLVEELAFAMNAAVAGSRVAMDCGWVSRERMVGESGRSVAPKLYVALGISGAPQHVAGIKEARFVVAINSDKHAPIFRIADVGIVGDLRHIVPTLTKNLRRLRPVAVGRVQP